MSRGGSQALTRRESEAELLRRFNPDVQRYCAANVDRCFTADVPTLRDVRRQYSLATVEAWLDIQLADLVRFCGVKGKDEFTQIVDMLVAVIADNFANLKLSEMLLFFQWFKSGRFGRFFGVIDAYVITDALQRFCTAKLARLAQIARKREQDKLRQHEAERRRQEQNGELLTAAEWKERRKQYEM